MLRTWPLSKRFALLSGPVLIGAGVLIGAMNHSWFLESIENAAERNNVALARVLSNVVWPKFETDVRSREETGTWPSDLNREIASLIRHSSIVKVKLYRADGSVAYSTDPRATQADDEGAAQSEGESGEAGHGEAEDAEAGHPEEGEAGSDNDGFEAAIKGEVVSEIEFEPSLNIFGRVIENRHTVSSYIPIFDTDEHRRPVAVFEIYDDITELLSDFRHSEIRVGLFLGSVLLLIYATLVMMVVRSELVARRNQEARERMAGEAARADAASTAKSEFLANMSHELRTPLNAIVGFSEVMKDGLLGPVTPRPYAEYVRHIWVAASHLTDIIGNILDLSKIDAGKATVEMSHVALPETIVLVCSMMNDKAGKRGVALTQEIEPGIESIFTDAVKLRQILLNLLSNAIKFTAAGGRVALHVGRTGEDVVFSIRDTGIGMDEDGIKIALSPFGQVESPFSRMHEGTGLGLPLTQRLVALIGGRMELSSQKGIGTLVTVTLPIGERAAPVQEAEEAPAPRALAG